MGGTRPGLFRQDPEKHHYAGCSDVKTRRHDPVFHLYISPEENEQTIEYLLEQYPEFDVFEIDGYEGFACGMPEVTASNDKRLSRTVRIFPHRMKGEGHSWLCSKSSALTLRMH